MSDVLQTEEYKGLTIRIVADEDVRDPLEDDTELRLVGWHRRYVNPTPEFKDPESVIRYARESGAHLLKVYMYDHSGTIYRLGDANPFSDGWDSGWFGFLIVEKSFLDQHGWKRITPKRHKQLMEWMAGYMEEYTAYANGQGCGFQIVDASGKELDSCYGFLSETYCLEAARESADDHAPEEAA